MNPNNFYKPTKQTEFGLKGNCLSACIATLFDIGIEDVPNFADYEEDWAFRLSKWMVEKFNKYVVVSKFTDLKTFDLLCGSLIITAINSRTIPGARHAVIVQENTIVFDPLEGEVSIPLTDSKDPTFLMIGDIRRKGKD